MTKQQKKLALEKLKYNRFIVKPFFKERRIPILELKFQGYKNKQIADMLGESQPMVSYAIRQSIGDK